MKMMKPGRNELLQEWQGKLVWKTRQQHQLSTGRYGGCRMNKAVGAVLRSRKRADTEYTMKLQHEHSEARPWYGQ